MELVTANKWLHQNCLQAKIVNIGMCKKDEQSNYTGIKN